MSAPPPPEANAAPPREHGLHLAPTQLPRSSYATETGDSAPTAVDPGHGSLPAPDGERYAARALLGEGGMGEVHLCHDARVGRDVAMKVVRHGTAPGASDVHARFLREARVQGQLEHPAIVPVYDLGLDAHGRTFFTMKRVRGVTLEEVLALLRAGDRATAAKYGRRKLLTAFGQVCLAVHYAHERGVLHRDLKPGNVMLGDFGEVYVLDWGLAKLAAYDDAAAAQPAPALVASFEGGTPTQAGAVLGTPGYMAPEQVDAAHGPLDRQANVYALGAILYEILTLEPLHAVGDLHAMLASTMSGADARACARCPDRDVPPELEAICLTATALDPTQRFATARDLSDAIERFLDGDRDVEHRRELVTGHLRVAELAATRGAQGGPTADADRAVALRELGRALALDPANAQAARAMVALLVTPPAVLPADARAEMDLSRASAMRVAARAGGWAYASWFLYVPLFVWLGLRSVPQAILVCVMMAASAAVSFVIARQKQPRPVAPFVIVSISTVAIACLSRIAGPFVIVPTLAVANTLGFAMFPDRAKRTIMVAIGCSAVVVPAALEWLGVLPRSYAFEHGHIVVLPQLHEFPQVPTLVVMLVTAVAVIVTSSIYVGRISDALVDAEERLYSYAWSLRQLVPPEAREGAPAPTVAPPIDYLACALDDLAKHVRALPKPTLPQKT